MDSPHNDKLYRVGTLLYSRRQLAVLFFWLLWGDVCYQLMETVVPSILPVQFEHLRTSNKAMAIIMSTIPMMITAVANPIISFKSDRHRGRWGRRIPFIVCTLPFLVLSIIALGHDTQISNWVIERYSRQLHLSPYTIPLLVIGGLMAFFTFFNSFVGSVYWYLFNDVVPEHLLARFMSLFRLVALLSQSIYNMFIFGHANHHSTEIMTWISLLYFVGFGLMCLNVKEGKYPPSPAYVGGEHGPLAAIATFGKECLTLRHYWFVFLTTIFSLLAGAAGIFSLYFYQSTGMTLAQYGRIGACGSLAVAALIPISGWLADRFHPIRIVIAGYIVNLVISIPASMIWLFWHPKPNIAFWAWIGMTILLGAPASALMGVYDPPLFMVTFPRSRYGQYCSANAMLRAMAGIVGGLLAGAFFDYAGHYMTHKDVYRLMPVWQMFFTLFAFISILCLYRSWKQYGGDGKYVPPIPGETLAERLAEEIPEEEISAQEIHVEPEQVPLSNTL